MTDSLFPLQWVPYFFLLLQMAMMMSMKYDNDNHADEDEIVNLIAHFFDSHCFPLFAFLSFGVDDEENIFLFLWIFCHFCGLEIFLLFLSQ